ncbi:hypothetical protein [Shimia sagamensis]|uniref:Oxidoreductase n=1 Tax=Shimia sagamensis TaxID=1566352 RepID=A0ABY1NYV2_9RHOB|nr:hypothetical protein [Shimia sagamensis]SMP22273.1 hypothetical protein SAMN06265373_104148 [Shimia sagamensis]
MTVFRDQNKLTLVSPIRLSEDGLAALDGLGQVTNIVKLGGYHLGAQNGLDHAFSWIATGRNFGCWRAQNPMPSTSAIAASCAAIEAFTRTAATKVDQVRMNVVSPIFVKERMALFGLPTESGLSAADTARSYLAAVNGAMHSQVLATPDYA